MRQLTLSLAITHMKIIPLLVILSLAGCGNRTDVDRANLVIDNRANIFQTNAGLISDYIKYCIDVSLKQRGEQINWGSDYTDLKITLISDTTKFNRNWFSGDNYDRTLVANVSINGKNTELSVSCNWAKDGALDRFVGSVTGLGSHPSQRVFPGTAGALLGSLSYEISGRIRGKRTATDLVQK